MTELREKLKVHQEKLGKKKNRRAKWENWKKTQAMFYCKTSTNYNKWDMFESESDPDEKEEDEPIVNENDPAIKAMEQDFKDRSQRRKRGRLIAEEFKAKGNEAMKRGLYKSAYSHYTEAMDNKKDMLILYTNRALACLKLENIEQAIDDCTRPLEYCDVFDDCYTKQKDLCYKAFMRRGQALKFQKDFKLAIEDFKEAEKLQKDGETDAVKWIKLTEEDQLHHTKICEIMANADSLKGKEYLDYLISFLKGDKDEVKPEQDKKTVKKRKQVCFHELSADECAKLTKTLEAENMVYYFSVNNGFNLLVDSLYFSTVGLTLVENLLEKHPKL